MDFFKLEIDENYSMGLEYISKHSDTNFSDLRNLLSLKTPGLDFKAIESEVDENYNMGSEYISKHSDTIFSKKSIKTHCVLGSPTLESCMTGRFLIPLELVSIC